MSETRLSSALQGAAFLWQESDYQETFTPEDFGPDDRAMAQAAREFVEKEVLPRQAELDAKQPGLMARLAHEAGELGFYGLQVPEEYGGLGMSKPVSCLVDEQLGRNGSFAVTSGAHTGIGTMPITYFGSEAAKAKYLPKLAQRRVDSRVLPDRGRFGLGRAGHADPGDAQRRWAALCAQRLKNVDLQRRICRRVRHHRSTRRRSIRSLRCGT